MLRWYEGRLIDVQGQFLLVVEHLGDAADDDPVLATVMVHLQAEAGTNFYLNALDLEVRPLFEDRVGAPGAMDGVVQLVGLVALGLELSIDLLHFLGAMFVRYQQGIWSIDDDQVVDAYDAHQAVLAVDSAIATVDHHRIAIDAIVVGIRRFQVTQGPPAADVTPADVAGHHGGIACLLHDGVVDGVVGD